jgi:hypothetical protein
MNRRRPLHRNEHRQPGPTIAQTIAGAKGSYSNESPKGMAKRCW